MPEAELAVPAVLRSGGGATGSAVPGIFVVLIALLATVLRPGGGAIGCAGSSAALLSCVLPAFFKSGAGAIGSGIPRNGIAWLC